MCTFIAKVTENSIAVLDGPCCMTVEDIEALCPKICRKNGWREYSVDDCPERRKEVHISLGVDIAARCNVNPVATLSYRGGLLHFRSVEQVRIVREYIAEVVRTPRRHGQYERYLRALPSVFLARHARQRILKRLDVLLRQLPPVTGPSVDAIRYAVSDGVGVKQLGKMAKPKRFEGLRPR